MVRRSDLRRNIYCYKRALSAVASFGMAATMTIFLWLMLSVRQQSFVPLGRAAFGGLCNPFAQARSDLDECDSLLHVLMNVFAEFGELFRIFRCQERQADSAAHNSRRLFPFGEQQYAHACRPGNYCPLPIFHSILHREQINFLKSISRETGQSFDAGCAECDHLEAFSCSKITPRFMRGVLSSIWSFIP